MYNAAIKAIITCVTAALLAGCSGRSAEADAADSLLAEADSAICTGDFERAIALLDTLKERYPRQIEAQRRGIGMRPHAIEGVTIAQIEDANKQAARFGYLADSLTAYFTKVHNPELGDDYDYWVARECKGIDLFGRTGIQGRVSPSGEFYVLSSLAGPQIKHTSVSLSSGADKVSTVSIAYDGERNYRSSGTEMITFTGAECDTLGVFANSGHPASAVRLTFNGPSKIHTVKIAAADYASLQRGYQLATAIAGQRRMTRQLELLERQLQLARDQAARTSPE